MDTRIINHRRDRQQTRRILAELRVRYRDFTGSASRTELDLLDGRHRPYVFQQPVLEWRCL